MARRELDSLIAELVPLRRARMTQREMADRIGSSQAAISNMETGMHEPWVSTLRRYAEALGMEVVVVPASCSSAVEHGREVG